MIQPILVARSGKTELGLLPALANRHGLITGATGTGKTVSLQTMAQGFSAIGAGIKSAARTIGSQVGREIIGGLLGSILGGKRR